MDTPKIYVADIAAYNEGKLIGEWVDLSDYNNGEEVMEKISELLKKWSETQNEDREEYAIHDFENFSKSLYHESMGESDFDKVIKVYNISNERDISQETLGSLMAEYGIEPDDLEEWIDDHYQGQYDSDTDLAYDYVEQVGGVKELGDDTIERYFDYESFGRDLAYDYVEYDGHYFRTYKDGGSVNYDLNKYIKEKKRKDLFEDYENIPDEIQYILDKYSDDFEDGNYDGLSKALQEVEEEGYTFEYYLDGQAYGLRPKNIQLNELEGYEDFKEFKNGGSIFGSKRPKSAIIRDRAYKSNEPHELAYRRKSKRKNPRYKRYKRGGYVSKGEMVWRKLRPSEKMQFLYENFTPEITPRSQEILIDRAYMFLPRNVKIKIEQKYANVEDYAKGGGVGKIKVGDRIVDISYSNGNGKIIKDVDGTLFVVQFDKDPKGDYRNMNLWDIKKVNEYGKGGGVGINTEIILKENRPNGAKFRGVVKPFMLDSIEKNQYSGGFKRYEIDIYDEVDREPTKEEIIKANEFFDKIGGRYSKGGGVTHSTFTYYKVPNEQLWAIQECNPSFKDDFGSSCVVIRNKKSEAEAIKEVERLTKMGKHDYYAKGGGVNKISVYELDNFTNYVYDFYGKDGIYAEDFPNKGFSKTQIQNAVNNYIIDLHKSPTMTWGGGDSLDRERVREYLDAGEFEHGGDVVFDKEEEIRKNLLNGEISSYKLSQIIGCEPNYPEQIVGTLKLRKMYLRDSYSI